MNKKPSKKEGFTFIELNIAIVILLMGILFVGSLFTLSFKNHVKSQTKTTATSLAQQKLAEAASLIRADKTISETKGIFKDYPDYQYEISKKGFDWSDQLQLLTVKVCRYINGNPSTSSKLSQIVPRPPQKFRLYGERCPKDVILEGNIDEDNYIVSIETNIPDPGIYIINICGTFLIPTDRFIDSKITATSQIWYYKEDGEKTKLGESSINNFAKRPGDDEYSNYLNPNFTVITELDPGKYTFKWLASALPSDEEVICYKNAAMMTIEFLPEDMAELKELGDQ
ncbi:MAG: prepilin-type N-terminal cleavage/methylation domain-containing protein [Armatimonadota bacterium]